MSGQETKLRERAPLFLWKPVNRFIGFTSMSALLLGFKWSPICRDLTEGESGEKKMAGLKALSLFTVVHCADQKVRWERLLSLLPSHFSFNALLPASIPSFTSPPLSPIPFLLSWTYSLAFACVHSSLSLFVCLFLSHKPESNQSNNGGTDIWLSVFHLKSFSLIH